MNLLPAYRREWRNNQLASITSSGQPAADHVIVALGLKELAKDLTAHLHEPNPSLAYGTSRTNKMLRAWREDKLVDELLAP